METKYQKSSGKYFKKTKKGEITVNYCFKEKTVIKYTRKVSGEKMKEEKIYERITLVSLIIFAIVMIIEPKVLGYMVLGEGILWIILGIRAVILGIQGRLPRSNTRNWLRWY